MVARPEGGDKPLSLGCEVHRYANDYLPSYSQWMFHRRFFYVVTGGLCGIITARESLQC
jgi:hypothetical protein